MPRRLDRPAVVCTAAVSLAAALAGLLPATANADDAVEAPPPSLASLAEVVATAADGTVAVASEPVVEAASEPLAGTAPVPAAEPATAAPASPPAPETETPEAQTPALVDELAPAQEAGPQPDITLAEGDTTPDTPVSEPRAATPAPEPVAPPAEPKTPTVGAPAPAPAGVSANVNVSVRIGSPGDNGSVTQVNVTSGSSTAPSTASEPLHATTPTAPSPARQVDRATTSPAPVGGDSGTWYWQWDCLGTTPITAISSQGSEGGSVPASWTWIWNCDDNSLQYHEKTASRYQQINTNIAIRIASPGNDGHVTQVNTVAGVTVAWPTPASDGPVQPPSVPSSPGAGVEPGPVPVPAVAATALVTADITALPAPLEPATAASPESNVAGAAPPALDPLGASAGLPLAAGLRAGAAHRGWWPVGSGTPTLSSGRGGAVWGAERALHPTLPAPAPTARAGKRDHPPEASPRRRPQLPGRVPSLPISGASAAAVGGSASSGSGFPVILMIPFVAALLDLARRVALDHATWPSGHRRRVPDRPG